VARNWRRRICRERIAVATSRSQLLKLKEHPARPKLIVFIHLLRVGLRRVILTVRLGINLVLLILGIVRPVHLSKVVKQFRQECTELRHPLARIYTERHLLSRAEFLIESKSALSLVNSDNTNMRRLAAETLQLGLSERGNPSKTEVRELVQLLE
jgi:hypothetical protein